MESTTTLRTSIGCDGFEWKFGFSMVVGSADHTRNVRCGSTCPLSPRFGIREERCQGRSGRIRRNNVIGRRALVHYPSTRWKPQAILVVLLSLWKDQPEGYAHTSALSILPGFSDPFVYLSLLDADTRWCPQRSEIPAPPFIIEDVLQDSSTAPYPSNHAPRSMNNILVKEFPDMASVYCYNFRDEPLPGETAVDPRSGEGACVKHIFTGPYENLKVQATTLFLQIQQDIKFSWQSVAAGIAEGISTHLMYHIPVPYAPPTPSRPILFLGITPSRLDRQRDPTMHPQSTKAHLQVRQRLQW